jgi:hypothetical protein
MLAALRTHWLNDYGAQPVHSAGDFAGLSWLKRRDVWRTRQRNGKRAEQSAAAVATGEGLQVENLPDVPVVELWGVSDADHRRRVDLT